MTPHMLSEIVGEDAALSILSIRGGVRVYVPKTVTDRIIDELGGNADAAQRLCHEMGGLFITLPVARNWRAQRLVARGLSVRDAALSVGLTRRSVQLAAAETKMRPELPATSAA